MKFLGILLPVSLVCAHPLSAQTPLPQPAPTLSPTANNTWNLAWTGILDRTYFLQCSPDLEQWIYLPNYIETGTGQAINYGLSSPNQQAFFRLAFSDITTSDADTADFDGDGIGNLLEINAGTDPLDFDTDDDGLTNAEEAALGTSMTNPDSDGDGITDGGEVEEGTDPNDANDTPDAEWLTVTGDLAAGVVVMRNRSLTIPAGESRLVIVAIASDEYPIFTSGSQQNFEFNDILTWDVKLDGDEVLSNSIDVNARNTQWDEALANGQTLRGFDPVHFEAVKLITAPADADGQVEIELSAMNVEDGTHPSTVVVALLPVEIVPDYNRDGKITSADRGRISDENPFRWWVNDDNDWKFEEIVSGGTDTPGQVPGADSSSEVDWTNETVDGLRDLVDFFPLHLDLKGVLEVFPSDEYQYFIKHESGGIKFFEQPDTVLEEDEDSEGPSAYLRNLTKAKELATHPLKHANAAGVQLSEEILEAFRMGNGTLVCELTNATESPLVLEIRRSSGETLAEIEFPIKASSVEEMYRHGNMRHVAADGGTGGLRSQFGDPGEAYPDTLTNGDYFVFVHGFNVAPDAARGWHAEIFKRLHQLGNQTRFMGISWHGDVSPDYHRAVRNAFRTSRTLKNFLPSESGAKITIAAHSLGNMIVSNAIEYEGLEVDSYYMIDGAVPIEAYDTNQTQGADGTSMALRMTESSWKPYIDDRNKLFASDWHKLFPAADGRNELGWPGRFEEKVPQLAYNFYSTGEEVVKNPRVNESVGNHLLEAITNFNVTRYAWVAGEIGKGSGIMSVLLSDTHAGWDFHHVPGQRTNLIVIAQPQGYYKWELNPSIPSQFFTRELTPDEASELTEAELRVKPFFTPFENETLFHPTNGSAEAEEEEVQFRLFSTAIPAMTFGIGANQIDRLGVDNNFNMMSQKEVPNQWPRADGDWYHSDFRDVALSHTLPMYKKMIELNSLDQK